MPISIRPTRPPRPNKARVHLDEQRPTNTAKKAEEKPTPFIPPLWGGKIKGRCLLSDETDSKKLQEAKALVLELSPADKKQLLDFTALQLLGEHESGQTRDLDQWALAVYEAIVATIGTQGGGMAGPLPIKRLLAARASWAPVESFARVAGFNKMKVPERLAAYRLLAQLLVQRSQEVARAVRAPLTAKMVANNTGDLAAIFDAHFPGYMRSGLAAMLFRRATTARNEPS